MNNKHNVLIATLAVTAMILLAIVLAVRLEQPRRADAAAVGMKDGDYIMVPGRINNADYIYVVNIATRTMILYAPDRRAPQNPTIALVDKIDLDRVFAGQ